MNKKSYRELVKNIDTSASLLKESGSSCPMCEGGTVGEDGVCKNCKHHFPL